MTIGQNIRKYRKELGLTQFEVARKMGIIQPNIHRWETDKIMPSIETIKKLTEILHVPVEALLFTEKEKKRIKITDKELLEKLQDLDKLTPEDRTTIVNLIDTLKIKATIKK